MRIDAIDKLRGIAILGILFMNIYHLAAIEIGYSPFETPPRSDIVMNSINALFIDGRFRTLFCLLFGVSLVIQYEKLKHSEENIFYLLKSRLNWLVLFGLVHGLFIFAGDILFTYGLAGMLVYRKVSEQSDTLFNLAIKYIVIGISVLLLLSLIPHDIPVRYSEQYYELYNAWHSSFADQLIIQSTFFMVLALLNPISLIWYVGGVMLLGMSLYKSRFFNDGLKQSHLVLCITITLLISLFDMTLRNHSNTALSNSSFALASVSGIFCALIYSHIVIKSSGYFCTILRPFSNVGRLAFSFYITQSLVIGFLLRGYMPEFNLTATMVDYVLIAFIASLLQLMIAALYFKFFKTGPLEWLWRKCYHFSNTS